MVNYYESKFYYTVDQPLTQWKQTPKITSYTPLNKYRFSLFNTPVYKIENTTTFLYKSIYEILGLSGN